MKQLSVFLLAALLCSCLQRPPVEGNLSLFELEGDHYIKLELRNNTDEDLYIPHMSEYYSVFDENGVECSSIYYHYDGNPSGDFDFGGGMIGPDRVLGNRDDKYYEMLMSIEDSLRDLFYLYNPQFPDSVRQVLT